MLEKFLESPLDCKETKLFNPKGNQGSSQVVLVVNTLLANARDIRNSGSIPGSGRSTGGGHGNPHGQKILAIVHRIAELDMTETT